MTGDAKTCIISEGLMEHKTSTIIPYIIRMHRDINFSLHQQMISFRPFDVVFNEYEALWFNGVNGYGLDYEWSNLIMKDEFERLMPF